MNYKPLTSVQGVCNTATYLGIKISAKLEEIAALNYEALLKETINALKKWHKVPSSISGRINSIKMKILPKFLYLFRSIPLRINNSFFKRLDGIFSSSIWSYKKARRAIELLKLSFSQGGLDFPDFKLYFWSAFLGRMRGLANNNPLFFTYLCWEKKLKCFCFELMIQTTSSRSNLRLYGTLFLSGELFLTNTKFRSITLDSLYGIIQLFQGSFTMGVGNNGLIWVLKA